MNDEEEKSNKYLNIEFLLLEVIVLIFISLKYKKNCNLV